MSEYDYIAYIDEAGDPGLKKVLGVDAAGSSEWLILAGVVVARKNQTAAQGWRDDIIAAIQSGQMTQLHFRRLDVARKAIACEMLSALPVRIFVLASNKKNMKNWSNPAAAAVSLDVNWFYCWMVRALLERITNWVHFDAIDRFANPAK